MSSDPIPSTSSGARVQVHVPPSVQHESQPSTQIRDSRCCFHFTKYETFVYIVAGFGIIASIVKIVVIAMKMGHLYNEEEKFAVTSTYYFCAYGMTISAVVFLWEFPLMYFVRKRKLRGLQHWMFFTLMHFVCSCLGAVVSGAVYKIPGLFLSLSFVVDMIRSPAQMFFVHKFIKTEKLDEDSHFIGAYYKKF